MRARTMAIRRPARGARRCIVSSCAVIARTREASFVVVNPTHVAVAALRYAPPQ